MSLSEKLITASKSGNTRDVRKLLARGALFTKDKFGNTALHEGAWNGNNDIVKILLGAFCFVDSINHTGFTPLHLASQNGHAKVVKTLLKWKADPTLLNQHGETALHLVAKYNHANVVSAFAAFKINVNLRGTDGNTPLHIAAKLGNTEVLKALVQAGGDASIANMKSRLRSRPATITERPAQRARTPDEEVHPPHSHQPVHGRRAQRSMTTSMKFPFRPAKDVWAAVNKKKRKGPLSSLEQSNREIGSPGETREDLDGHGSGRGSPIGGKGNKILTIEQMLSEIEREYNGPDYRYVPQGGDVLASSSAPPSPPSTRDQLCDRMPAKTYLKSTQSSKPHRDNYDILLPGPDSDPPPPPPPHSIPSSVPPPMSAALQPQDSKQRFKHHTYEQLLPKVAGENPDTDTYVYMAPRKDFVRSTSLPPSADSSSDSELSQTRTKGVKRRAIICASPVHVDAKHEPNSRLEPARGILTQPSTESEKTQLERYLQDELDTMRQAFQIRLSQLEKRYQRQLILEQKRTGASKIRRSQRHSSPNNSQVQLREKKGDALTPNRASQRRNSWHSSLSDQDMDDMVELESRSGSLVKIGSDCSIDESDLERESYSGGMKRNGGIPDVYESDLDKSQESLPETNHSTPKSKQGLKGGARSWQEAGGDSPRLSPMRTMEEDESLTDEAKQTIHSKMAEYRGKMMQYFKEKSEDRIAAIERQYQAQMNEVQKKCEARAAQRMVEMEQRLKSLESKLEVRTLV